MKVPQMVACIGAALDVPLRGRNEMPAAAGFASLHPERCLVRAEMAPAPRRPGAGPLSPRALSNLPVSLDGVSVCDVKERPFDPHRELDDDAGAEAG